MSMTKETRIVFDLQDVRAVRIRCESCGEITLSSLSPTMRLLPSDCTWCGTIWQSDLTRQERNFLQAMVNMRDQKGGAVRLSLELDGSIEPKE